MLEIDFNEDSLSEAEPTKPTEISIEGNPYNNEDFFIYRNGEEIVSWNVDEMAEDEFSEETAQSMYDLYNSDKKELSKILDEYIPKPYYIKDENGKITPWQKFAKGGKTRKKVKK